MIGDDQAFVLYLEHHQPSTGTGLQKRSSIRRQVVSGNL